MGRPPKTSGLKNNGATAAEPTKTRTKTRPTEPSNRVTKRRQQALQNKPVVMSQPPKKRQRKESNALLNKPPTRRLDVYVFGANEYAQLGLGETFTKPECITPRFNSNLSGDAVGIVQLATGSMHSVALTYDNRILTWGVNDHGSLGRDTQWAGRMTNSDGQTQNMSDDSDDEDIKLNPKEATPAEINTSNVPPGTYFAQVVASDSATFALAVNGLVYGWGTFKGENGVFGFTPDVKIQTMPTLVPMLQNIVKLAAGENHVIALRSDGAVLAWGSGERNQLGHRILERRKLDALLPRRLGFRKGIVDIGVGMNHSFVIRQDGKVYSWGVNNSAQTGISSGAGESGMNILHPTEVPNLANFGKIICIDGGNEHTIAVTDRGECLVWGRIDNSSTGLAVSDLPSTGVIYSYNRPKILTVATQLPGIQAHFAAAGAEHNIVIDQDGKAYSWGFNDSHRTGHRGDGDDDVKTPTLLNSKSIQDQGIIWAGAGSAFSIIAAEHLNSLLNDVPS